MGRAEKSLLFVDFKGDMWTSVGKNLQADLAKEKQHLPIHDIRGWTQKFVLQPVLQVILMQLKCEDHGTSRGTH